MIPASEKLGQEDRQFELYKRKLGGKKNAYHGEIPRMCLKREKAGCLLCMYNWYTEMTRWLKYDVSTLNVLWKETRRSSPEHYGAARSEVGKDEQQRCYSCLTEAKTAPLCES